MNKEALLKPDVDSVLQWDIIPIIFNGLNEEEIRNIINNSIALIENYWQNKPIYEWEVAILANEITTIRSGYSDVEREINYKKLSKEMSELSRLLQFCEGNEIIISAYANPQKVKEERIKNSSIPDFFRVTITDRCFLEKSLNYAKVQGRVYEEWVKRCRSHLPNEYNLKRNQFLGAISHSIHRTIQKWYKNILIPESTSKTKYYSFIYDIILLGGAKGVEDVGPGFSGDVGHEKYQKVRDWLKSYSKLIEDSTTV